MAISVNSPSSMPRNINSENSLKVAAMSNKQQKVEGDIAMKAINSSVPPTGHSGPPPTGGSVPPTGHSGPPPTGGAVPPPTGNSGHNINVKA